MNDYEVIRQIGQGAFGKAFLVKDKGGGGNTQCVVKEISLRKVQQHSSVSLPAVLPGIRKTITLSLSVTYTCIQAAL